MEGEKDPETQTNGVQEKGDSDMDKICNSMCQLRIVIEVWSEVVVCCGRLGKSVFHFSS